MSRNKLERYESRRDFNRTREPCGTNTHQYRDDEPLYVIQKHDASSMHYDLRLEVGDVLKSWAVPKGPSTDPHEKRLAVETEDHPVDYADFEGVIPEGEYGAGTVMIWDSGTYRNLKTDETDLETHGMQQAYDDGHISVWLKGEKLVGGYALTYFRTQNGKNTGCW